MSSVPQWPIVVALNMGKTLWVSMLSAILLPNGPSQQSQISTHNAVIKMRNATMASQLGPTKLITPPAIGSLHPPNRASGMAWREF